MPPSGSIDRSSREGTGSHCPGVGWRRRSPFVAVRTPCGMIFTPPWCPFLEGHHVHAVPLQITSVVEVERLDVLGLTGDRTQKKQSQKSKNCRILGNGVVGGVSSSLRFGPRMRSPL